MKCHVCGSDFEPVITDLPFKRSEHSIVILRKLPVWQCTNCREYLIDNEIMKRVDEILDRVDEQSELEIVSFAA